MFLTIGLVTSCTASQSEHSVAPQVTLPVETLFFGDVKLIAEIADSQDERRAGLAHRQHLAKNHGMLFVYTDSLVRYFTMRDTLFDLSIAFLDEAGVILEIQKMQAQASDLYQSKRAARYALEVNRDWFDENALKAGDRMSLPATR